jgi:hypothetical protein
MPDVPQLLPLLAVAKALCVSPHTVRAGVGETGQAETRPVVPKAALPS